MCSEEHEIKSKRERESVCVCVCEREREREAKERMRETLNEGLNNYKAPAKYRSNTSISQTPKQLSCLRLNVILYLKIVCLELLTSHRNLN